MGGLHLDPVVVVCSKGALPRRAGCIAICSSFYEGVDAMMKAVSVAVRPSNLYVQSLGISWVHLLPIHCGVILIGAGLSAEDLGFESPLCRYQHPK